MTAPSGTLAASAPMETQLDEGVRLERLLPFGITALVLMVAIGTITPWPVGAFQDDAIYTVLAKSLATGEGYRMINLPGAPHATHYPPGYPLFLAALWRIAPGFPDNLVVFKFANAALLALSAFGAYRFARGRLSMASGAAALAALVGTLSIVVLLITGVVLSEPLFMALLIPGLLLAERSAETGDRRLALAAGLLLGALALVRTLGAVTVPAAALVLVVRRRPAAAAILVAGAAALLVPWQLWLGAYQQEIPAVVGGKYGAYGPWMAEGYREGGLPFARAVVVANAQSFERMFGFLFMPVRAVLPRAIAFAGVLILLGAGVALLVRRAPVTAAFLALYAAVILVWPFEPDRFVLAVWPLLALVAVSAVAALWRWRPEARPARLGRLVALAVIVYLAAGFTVYNYRGYRDRWWASVQRDAGRRAKPIAEWVARHTAMSDVLATEDDLIVYLYTGRRALPTTTFLARERLQPLTPEEEMVAVRTLLATYKPRFFIAASKAGIMTADSLALETPPLLRRYGQTTNALVYEHLKR